jgi:2-polyprenyl-3-methyl-5-hydroxy-6-metoxy-1,4-benzoquinol methylase
MADDATPASEKSAGAVAADGTAVEIYRRLPSLGEIEYVESLLSPNSSVLDLGAGTGRIADPLAELGHRVTAVDESPEMLAHIRHARKVEARIEDLRLAERFDTVLVIGNMINYPGTQRRRAVLGTVAHHLAPSGQAIIQWAPPEMLAARPTGWTKSMTIGAVTTKLTIHSNRDGISEGEFTLAADGQVWRQSLTAQEISAATLRDELTLAELVLTTDDPEATRWLHAKRRD